eukprot:TRINITY_DN45405_c0_g1_i1.p1 TRINITY_DN45405_c0_g1~~TRINITY_DN45405_c0_g1_i1.p1  ORF type:complete len:711 (-),score=145.01 TRINITY_DN45405_c0_g1_i1:114-2246(-)
MTWHAVVVASIAWFGLATAATLTDAQHRGNLQVAAGGQVFTTNPSVMRRVNSVSDMTETKLSFMQSEDLGQDLVIARQEAAKAGSGVGFSDQRLQEILAVTSAPSLELVQNPSLMEEESTLTSRSSPVQISPSRAAATSAASAAREQASSDISASSSQAVKASSQVVSEHTDDNAEALKIRLETAQEIGKIVEKSARSVRTREEVAKPVDKTPPTKIVSASPSFEEVSTDADAVSDDLAFGSETVRPHSQTINTASKESNRMSATTTKPELNEEQLMSQPMTAQQVQALGPIKSAALYKRLQVELSEEKDRAVRDEKVLAAAISKLSSGKPFADFVAGMDTGEIPRDGLSQEKLQDMTQDSGHAQFALKATVKILGQIVNALSSGKDIADVIFGSDTSDLAKPPSSSATTQTTPTDAFNAIDTNKDGSIQRKEWDKAPHALKTSLQRPSCSSEDLRQIFTAMDSSCQASIGRALISELPSGLSRVRAFCPCISAAVPRLSEAFLRNDCMLAGTIPLSKLCPRVEAPLQPSATPEAGQQSSMATSPATVDAWRFTSSAQSTQEYLPSGMRPTIAQQDVTAFVPPCTGGELQKMFGAMDDKCKASVGSNFVTNPLNPSLELNSLCMCVNAATKKLALKDCAPQGQGRPGFQMICDRPEGDDNGDQTDEADISATPASLSAKTGLALWSNTRYTEVKDEIMRFGKRLMQMLPN